MKSPGFLFLIFPIILVAKTHGGVFKALLYSDWILCNHDRNMELDVSDVQLYFYDFQNSFNMTFPISTAAQEFTSRYNLDITRLLIFFVPGYKSNIGKKTEELIRQTFKDIRNIYLIIVDHSTYTSATGGKIASYERSVLYTYRIGVALGKFLADLHKQGYLSHNIQAIGHSLGSQMLGFAGTTYTNETNEKIWRITGLDPAGPCFSNSLIQDQIRSGVADYVEVYHCNSGGLGTTSVLADTDFFVNRGKKQPSCHQGLIPGKGESDAAKCSHKKCVEYWAMTVSRPGWFLAWACDSYEHFMKGKCAANQVTIAGYSNPGNATGIFYTSTETYGIM